MQQQYQIASSIQQPMLQNYYKRWLQGCDLDSSTNKDVIIALLYKCSNHLILIIEQNFDYYSKQVYDASKYELQDSTQCQVKFLQLQQQFQKYERLPTLFGNNIQCLLHVKKQIRQSYGTKVFKLFRRIEQNGQNPLDCQKENLKLAKSLKQSIFRFHDNQQEEFIESFRRSKIQTDKANKLSSRYKRLQKNQKKEQNSSMNSIHSNKSFEKKQSQDKKSLRVKSQNFQSFEKSYSVKKSKNISENQRFQRILEKKNSKQLVINSLECIQKTQRLTNKTLQSVQNSLVNFVKIKESIESVQKSVEKLGKKNTSLCKHRKSDKKHKFPLTVSPIHLKLRLDPKFY